ncbi:MAG: hypothetical protein ACRC6V_04945 [Bacteroidales bacterium]
MKQVVWTTSNGEQIPIDEMDDLHVFNAVRVVYKRYNLPFKDMPRMLDEARNFLEDTVTGRNRTQLHVSRLKNNWY